MRYVFAIAALVISGVLLVLGIGQRTFLAGPTEIDYSIESSGDASFAVIDGAEFEKVTGQSNVVVKGGNGFVATGASRDVLAWVAPFDYEVLTVEKAQSRVEAQSVPATPIEDLPGYEAPVSSESEGDETVNEADGEQSENRLQPLDPRGSDLWLEERATPGDDSTAEAAVLRVPVAVTADQSVIIGTDGEGPLPEEMSIVWAQDRETPWAGPLLTAGLAFGLIGGVLYLLAIDHNRRGLGPRRGRRGPLQGIRNSFTRSGRKDTASFEAASEQVRGRVAVRRSRRLALPALGLAVALGFTGCSADYWPDFVAEQEAEGEAEPEPTQAPSSLAPVPVTDGQLSKIVQRVAATAGEADDALDATLLEERFTGDALAQRSASYLLRSALPDTRMLPPRITDTELDYELVQSTESWPRTLFVTVESEPGDVSADTADTADTSAEDVETEGAEEKVASPSLAMILTQENPQANYMVSRVIALRGGISMPAAAPAEEGTALLANDLESLVMPPGEVGAAFAALLQNGTEDPAADAFDIAEDDSMLENYGRALAARTQAQISENDETMVASSVVRVGDEPAVALSTGVGGAIVATTVIDEQISDADGGRFKPNAENAVTALSGLEGEQERIVQEVAHQLLVFVPSKSSGEKIQLLGVTSELVGARN